MSWVNPERECMTEINFCRRWKSNPQPLDQHLSQHLTTELSPCRNYHANFWNIQPCQPALCQIWTLWLCRPHTCIRDRAFSIIGPRKWNSLLLEIWIITERTSFKHALKTPFYNLAYNWIDGIHKVHLNIWFFGRHNRNRTYLYC